VALGLLTAFSTIAALVGPQNAPLICASNWLASAAKIRLRRRASETREAFVGRHRHQRRIGGRRADGSRGRRLARQQRAEHGRPARAARQPGGEGPHQR
jgi:hypothetical protein